MHSITYKIPATRYQRKSGQTHTNLTKNERAIWIKYVESRNGTYKLS